MKVSIKLSGFAFALLLMLCVCCIFVIAAEDEPLVYTVETEDGTVTKYGSSATFKEVVEAAPSGAVVTLYDDVELTSGIYIYGTASEHKEITVDLAGHGIYSTMKNLVSTLIAARDYSTVNVTSSKPDAFLYMIDAATNSRQGGNIFSSIGVDALINFGGCVSLKGERYPGDNISTFSSCFIDVRNMGTLGFNCDGGTHFANIADWLGFITPRSGNGTVMIKNANILVDQNTSLIYSEENSPRLYLENCLIARLDGADQHMFGQIHASVVIKNCITNYSLAASGIFSEGVVTLEGNNVFGAGLGFNTELIKDGYGKVAARVNVDAELISGGKNFYRYDNAGKFNKLSETLPEFTKSYTFASYEDTFRCTWQYDGMEESEDWLKGENPKPIFKILATGVDGVYKKGWLKTEDTAEGVVFKSTCVNDFNLKIKAVRDGESFYYAIYAPAFVFDDGYVSYAEGKIGGAGFTRGDWTPVELDGVKYYEYTTMDMSGEDIDAVLEISLPCDVVTDSGKLVKTEGIYRINLSGYIEKIYGNMDAYSEEQLALVSELEEIYFPKRKN